MSLLNLLQDVSGNQLMDISSLNSLTHLLTLKADRNALHSAKLDEVGTVRVRIMMIYAVMSMILIG